MFQSFYWEKDKSIIVRAFVSLFHKIQDLYFIQEVILKVIKKHNLLCRALREFKHIPSIWLKKNNCFVAMFWKWFTVLIGFVCSIKFYGYFCVYLNWTSNYQHICLPLSWTWIRKTWIDKLEINETDKQVLFETNHFCRKSRKT